MNQFHYPFEKILNLKLRERDILQNSYAQAVHFFEEVGTELYKVLKKKEEFVENQMNSLTNGVKLHEVQLNQNYLDQLLIQINQLQIKLMKARTQMEEIKEKLIVKSIELKKYEKLKERFKINVLQNFKRLEQLDMDEISSIRSVKGIR